MKSIANHSDSPLDYQELQYENKLLRSGYESVREELAALKSKVTNKDLSAANAFELREENEHLRKNFSRVNIELICLQRAFEKLSDEKSVLADEYHTLWGELLKMRDKEGSTKDKKS